MTAPQLFTRGLLDYSQAYLSNSPDTLHVRDSMLSWIAHASTIEAVLRNNTTVLHGEISHDSKLVVILANNRTLNRIIDGYPHDRFVRVACHRIQPGRCIVYLNEYFYGNNLVPIEHKCLYLIHELAHAAQYRNIGSCFDNGLCSNEEQAWWYMGFLYYHHRPNTYDPDTIECITNKQSGGPTVESIFAHTMAICLKCPDIWVSLHYE